MNDLKLFSGPWRNSEMKGIHLYCCIATRVIFRSQGFEEQKQWCCNPRKGSFDPKKSEYCASI